MLHESRFRRPIISDAASICEPDIIVRRPAVQGDLLRAVLEGASVIGLIDGNFEYAPPVRHKEILFGLSRGRAHFRQFEHERASGSECRVFGMIEIGEVYRRYVSADLIDDSDVALVHAPAEIGYIPLSIPLVNLVITLERMTAARRISRVEQEEFRGIAAGIFYKERTWKRLAKAMKLSSVADEIDLLKEVRASHFDVKRADALELCKAVTESIDQQADNATPWKVHSTSMRKDALNSAKRRSNVSHMACVTLVSRVVSFHLDYCGSDKSAEPVMTAALPTLAVCNPTRSTDSEIEELHAIARLVVFARESAANLDAHQTVYCLDLTLEQIATELRHRADNSGDVASYFKDAISRQ